MMWSYAVISGASAAFAGVCGKFSGESWVEDHWVGYAIKLVFFGAMLALNTVMWTYYVKALQVTSSFKATVASSATNFLLSGLLGVFVLGEVTGILWWLGIFFVLIGLILIQNSEDNLKES